MAQAILRIYAKGLSMLEAKRNEYISQAKIQSATDIFLDQKALDRGKKLKQSYESDSDYRKRIQALTNSVDAISLRTLLNNFLGVDSVQVQNLKDYNARAGNASRIFFGRGDFYDDNLEDFSSLDFFRNAFVVTVPASTGNLASHQPTIDLINEHKALGTAFYFIVQ